MSQHDLVIDNAGGATVRADINSALAALGSTMKGANAPSAPLAGMLWVEDDNPSTAVWTLKIYDGADWSAVGELDATNNRFTPNGLFLAGSASAPGFAPAGDSDTGLWAPAANTVAFSTAGTERFRLDGSGNILVGQSSTATPGSSNTTAGAAIGTNGTMHLSAASGSYVMMVNRNADGNAVTFSRSGTSVGSISVTSTATAYNTSSDYRLKDELEPIDGAVALVTGTPVYRFRWKATPLAPKVTGFLAHEAQAAVPEAVTGQKDGPQFQAIDQAKLVPVLWAAVQELAARVAALEAAAQ